MLAGGLVGREGGAQDRDEMQRAYQNVVRSVVSIEARHASIFAPPGAGSGVVIDDQGLIATADHVVDGAAEIWVVHAGGQRERAAVVSRAPDRDLALLRISVDPALMPLAPRGGAVWPGQCVLALGNVMNAGIGIFAGIVSLANHSRGPAAGRAGGILTDITTPPGLSGGALVACDDGDLVGIISFGLVALGSPAATAGIVGAVPVAELLGLVGEQAPCVRQPGC